MRAAGLPPALKRLRWAGVAHHCLASVYNLPLRLHTLMHPLLCSYTAFDEQQRCCAATHGRARRAGAIQLYALQAANCGVSFLAFLLAALQKSGHCSAAGRHCLTARSHSMREPAKARKAAHCRAQTRGPRRNNPALGSGKISATLVHQKWQLLPARPPPCRHLQAPLQYAIALRNIIILYLQVNCAQHAHRYAQLLCACEGGV